MLRKEETRYRHSVYLVRLSNRGVHSSSEKNLQALLGFLLFRPSPPPPLPHIHTDTEIQTAGGSFVYVQGTIRERDL